MTIQLCRRQRHRPLLQFHTCGESPAGQWIHASLALRPDLNKSKYFRILSVLLVEFIQEDGLKLAITYFLTHNKELHN